MVVAGLYETMHKSFKRLEKIPALIPQNRDNIINSINLNEFMDKIKQKKKPVITQKLEKSKSEFHSSFTKILLPYYTLRILKFQQKHLQILRIFTFILITTNTVVLCVDWVDFSRKTRKMLRILDFGLLMVFYCEILIKLLFQKKFFQRFLNVVDFAIFLLNLSSQIYFIAIDCDFLEGKIPCSAYIYDLIRAFQVLRILRILISSVWINISILILELIKILRKMHGFLIILMIFLILFSLIGKDLFRFSNISKEIDNELILRVNFNSFLNAFFTNFLIFIDEEWQLIMFAHMKTFSNITASLYFVINLLFCSIFFNKVFLASLINNLINSKNVKRILISKTVEFSKFHGFLEKIKCFLCSSCLKKKKEVVLTRTISLKSVTNKSKTMDFNEKSRKTLQISAQFKNTDIKTLKQKILEIRKHRYFSKFMLISVFYSLILLALYDPYQSSQSRYNVLVTYLDIPVFIIFTIELLFELIPHENGYFSMPIIMKVLICLLYFFYFIFEVNLLKFMLIFRLFLVANFSKELKLAFEAFFKSILDILQLFFFFLLISVFFALIGVKCLQGAFWQCKGLDDILMAGIGNREDCFDFGGDWMNNDFNFDNIFNALEMMFIVANTEGWLSLMYNN